jgi:hypothetical protein
MVSVVIYGIIAIALAAAAGYALLVFSSTTQQTTQVQENSVRMEQAANALRASLLALDGTGTLFTPMGYNPGTTGSYTQLPTSLGAVSSSPWGTPFEYCPVSLNNATGLAATSSSTVTEVSGATYTVGVYQSTATNANNYVITTSGTPANLANSANYGYVAFIVSSLGSGQTVPDCSAITISSTGVSVTGGSVRGVTAGFTFNQRVIASTDRMELYVGTGGSTYTGTGDNTGRDINNLTTLPNAVAIWQALQPRLTDIYLTGGGTYTLSSDINAQTTRLYGPQEGAALNFLGENGPDSAQQATLDITVPLNPTTPVTFANLVITDSASVYMISNNFAAPLTFYQVNLTGPTSFEPIYTQGLTQLIQTNLTNVNFQSNGGTVIVNPNATAISFTNTAFTVNNGRFYLYGNNVSVTSTITQSGQSNFDFISSAAQFDPNTLTVSNSGGGVGFISQFNSSLLFNSATVTATQKGGGWAFIGQFNSSIAFNGSSTTPLTVTTTGTTSASGLLAQYNSNMAFTGVPTTITLATGNGVEAAYSSNININSSPFQINPGSGAGAALTATINSNLDIDYSTVTVSNANANSPVEIYDNSTMTLTGSTVNITDSNTNAGIGLYAIGSRVVSNASTVSVSNAASGTGSHAIYLDPGAEYDSYGISPTGTVYSIVAAGNTYSPLSMSMGSSANLYGAKIRHNGTGPCLYVLNDANTYWLPITQSSTANGTNQLYLPYYTTSSASSQDINNANSVFESSGSFSGTSSSIALTPTMTPTQVDPTSFINVLDDFASKSFANKRLTFNTFTCN